MNLSILVWFSFKIKINNRKKMCTKFKVCQSYNFDWKWEGDICELFVTILLWMSVRVKMIHRCCLINLWQGVVNKYLKGEYTFIGVFFTMFLYKYTVYVFHVCTLASKEKCEYTVLHPKHTVQHKLNMRWESCFM